MMNKKRQGRRSQANGGMMDITREYNHKIYCREWRRKNRKKIGLINKKYNYSHPWAKILRQARQRCSNKNSVGYKNYGGRGIRCFLVIREIRKLWERDNASVMERPSIDRINNDGHYEYNNCRFIELAENIRRSFLTRDPKSFCKPPNVAKWVSIKQYNPDNKFIKQWENIEKASEELKISYTGINNCLRKRSKFSGGFKWEYAQKEKS